MQFNGLAITQQEKVGRTWHTNEAWSTKLTPLDIANCVITTINSRLYTERTCQHRYPRESL